MLGRSFPGHRRYSITHRAVQRLRELVLAMDDLDDEALRDRLDLALSRAEEEGKAVRTLDAMLGEPQVLIPVADFGTVLYAIIKEETVVTVLPQGHGEEILHRGQALQDRVASGEIQVPEREREDDRWDAPRRRWRREGTTPVIVERQVRVLGRGGEREEAPARPAGAPLGMSTVRPPHPEAEVENLLYAALQRASRAAALVALGEVLAAEERDAELGELWTELSSHGLPRELTVGDLIDTCKSL